MAFAALVDFNYYNRSKMNSNSWKNHKKSYFLKLIATATQTENLKIYRASSYGRTRQTNQRVWLYKYQHYMSIIINDNSRIYVHRHMHNVRIRRSFLCLCSSLPILALIGASGLKTYQFGIIRCTVFAPLCYFVNILLRQNFLGGNNP